MVVAEGLVMARLEVPAMVEVVLEVATVGATEGVVLEIEDEVALDVEFDA